MSILYPYLDYEIGKKGLYSIANTELCKVIAMLRYIYSSLAFIYSYFFYT